MTTKNKTARPKETVETSVPATGKTLESKLGKAIEQFSANRAKEALAMFEAIAKEAVEIDNLRLARVARSYIAAAQSKGGADTDADPVQEAIFLLNTDQPEEALVKIDKLLKTKKTNAHLHYLKALALAGTQEEELSAASLQSAIDLDSNLLHVYKLEPEFKSYRKSPSFAVFEQE